MKKLICAKDVEACAQKGEHVMVVDANTLITPSARDAAANAGITFSEGQPACAESAAPSTNGAGIDSDVIYKALQVLVEKGMLGQLMNLVGQDVAYVSESDSQGMVKLIRSHTAKWEQLDTGNPANQVYYNELIGKADGATMNAGFMTIDRCTFSWDVDCQEIYYVVEGTLVVKKDGRVFTAHPGDCLLFKRGAKLEFGSDEKVKVFYTTH